MSLNKVIKSYLSKDTPTELDITYLLYLLNMSRDTLEHYLVRDRSFQILPSGCLLKGSGPIILTAHIDTENTKWFGYQEDFYYPIPIKKDGNYISKDNEQPHITDAQKKMCLGGDDRCGVFLALTLYKLFPDKFTLFFTDQEERGHGYNTAELAPSTIWKNKFVICLDTSDRAVFSYHSHLEKHLKDINKKLNFHWEERSLSNLQYMAGSIGINLGVGYYEYHTKDEYISIKDLNLAYQYVLELLKMLKV